MTADSRSPGVGPVRTVDLHGLTQAEAQARLMREIGLAAMRGEARLRVVTGRGHSRKGADQGILRLAVPRWLKGSRFAPLVAGITPEPGNPGALGVTLRPRRSAGSSA